MSLYNVTIFLNKQIENIVRIREFEENTVCKT